MADDYTVVQIASTHGPDQFLIWEGYQYGDVIASCAKKSDADRIVAALRATRAAPEPSEAQVAAALRAYNASVEAAYTPNQRRAMIAALRAAGGNNA